MPRRQFAVYLRGLSAEAMWRHALRKPIVVQGEAAAALIDKM